MSKLESLHIGLSRVHGTGAFASRDLSPGERLGVYRGRRYGRREAARRDWDQALTYLFALTDGSFIDGSRGGNATRHLNHSCAPNCIAYEEPDARGRTRVAFYALRAIRAGEELFLDYSLDADPSDATAFACACGTKLCRGTMLAPRP